MERIVDIATDGRHLSAYRGFLLVREERIEVGRIPLDDIAAVIVHAHGVTWTTSVIAARVRSGDPDNVEAQAARGYWPALMGENFRRDRDAGGMNGLLNYGYTVLRSLCARAVVAAGLHPSIGIHHANRGNAFALADDLVEPLRPLVDVLALKLTARGVVEVTPEAKRAFAGLIALDLPGEAGVTTVAMAATRTAQSLARCFEAGRAEELVLPRPPSPLEFAGLEAVLA